MSTRGCILIRSGEHRHPVFIPSDSYPDSLGRSLIEQLAQADLVRWAQLGACLRATEHWLGPDFRLTANEVAHIRDWFSQRVDVHTAVVPDRESSTPNSVRVVCSESTGPVESGEELARLMIPVLNHDPQLFFDIISWKIEVLLHLGLVPRLSARYVRSPFCEWIYVLDFTRQVFSIGTAWEPSSKPTDENVWEPEDDGEIEVRCYVQWPLGYIPSDWEELLEAAIDGHGD